MYGKVSDISPKVTFVEKGDFFGNTRLWGRHILYNTHELYLGAKASSTSPVLGEFVDPTPILYKVAGPTKHTTNFIRKLYNTADLYTKYYPYLVVGNLNSDLAPPMGCIESNFPKMYSISND